jgi:hypothetical protein
LIEGRIALPADAFEPVLNIGLHFAWIHRIEMMCCNDPLAQLLERRIALDHVTKFRLT